MADIFSPWHIGRLIVPNRLVRSATWEGLADEKGFPSHDLILALAELAENHVGLVITGYAFVSPEGKGLPKQTGVHLDALIGPLTRISDAVHKAGGVVAMQIAHAGGQTKPKWVGQTPVGPSAMIHPVHGNQVAELTRDQIYDLVDDFARAAGRVKAAGFDAVQLHAAHGYLINQFLSPAINQRQDEFGGELEGRARFLFEVYAAVRDEVGPHYPVFVKLQSMDYVENGFTLEEALRVSKGLDERGIDAIEASGGQPSAAKAAMYASNKVKGPEDEGYFLENAKVVKQVVSCPVISVGGWRSKDLVENALDSVDAVALCRPFIRQPNLAKLWKQGDAQATCISCNGCIKVGKEQGLGCAQEIKKKDSSD